MQAILDHAPTTPSILSGDTLFLLPEFSGSLSLGDLFSKPFYGSRSFTINFGKCPNFKAWFFDPSKSLKPQPSRSSNYANIVGSYKDIFIFRSSIKFKNMYSLIDIHLQLWLYSQGLESYLLIENGKVNIFFVLQPVEKIEKVGREYKVSYYDFVSERWVYEIITDERLLFTNKAGQCFIVRLGTLCFVDGIPVMRAHRIEGRGVNPARLLLRS